MNLQDIAVNYISAVNPQIAISIQVATGFTIGLSGKQVPSYASPVVLPGQVQPLTYSEIRQLDSLNIQGTRRAIYVNGRLDGLVRVDKKGGDLITITDGPSKGVWLVVLVLEQWPDWAKVAATLQNEITVAPTSDPSLDFSDPNNSQYIPGIS